MNEREIFVAALKIGNADERAAYLSEVCGHDANVRRVIANAARWAAEPRGADPTYGNARPSEPPG